MLTIHQHITIHKTCASPSFPSMTYTLTPRHLTHSFSHHIIHAASHVSDQPQAGERARPFHGFAKAPEQETCRVSPRACSGRVC